MFVQVAINNQYQRSGRRVRRVLSLVTRGLWRAPWVGGLMISIARLLVGCTCCAFEGGLTKCSIVLPATTNTICGGPVALD